MQQQKQQQGTPTAATPVPQPSLAPPPPPPASSGTRVDARSFNPTADAASALVQSSALVHQVERDLLTLLDRCQHAYNADAAPAPDSTTLLKSLYNLISLLSRSAVGGFVPPSLPPAPSETSAAPAAAAGESTTPSQAQLDQASERSQTLFKQLQTVRERAEIVRAGLARS